MGWVDSICHIRAYDMMKRGCTSVVERVHGDYMLPVSSKGRVVYVSVCDECMVIICYVVYLLC